MKFGWLDFFSNPGTPASNADTIIYSVFTCPYNGTADSISFNHNSTASSKQQCAIYSFDAPQPYTLIAQTEEITCGNTGGAYTTETANFSTKPTLVAGKEYILAKWSNANGNYVSETQLGYSRCSVAQAYVPLEITLPPPFPKTITGTCALSSVLHIYCNYTRTSSTSSNRLASWGEGTPDNTIKIAGYDSTSGVYRRILVDEVGYLQSDVVATIGTITVSGETLKITPLYTSGLVVRILDPVICCPNNASLSGLRVVQNIAEVSGQIVKILEQTGLSGQWVRQNPGEISGTRVIINPVEISGTRVIINPNEVSGQILKIFELQKSTTLSTRLISVTTDSGGTLIVSSDPNRKSLIVQYIDTPLSLSENPLISGQGIRLNSATQDYVTKVYNGSLWGFPNASGSIVVVSSEA